MKGLDRVRKKLISDDGASLMLALLFFLVCAVGGAVILASATASAGRVSSLKDVDRQQEEYAVDSAAALLKSELEKDSVYIKVTRTSPGFSNINEVPNDSAGGWTSSIEGICDANGNVKEKSDKFDFMEKFISNRLNKGSVDYDTNDYLTHTAISSQTPVLEITVENQSNYPVICATPSLSGDSQDTLKITLKKKNSGNEDDSIMNGNEKGSYTNTITGKMQIETVAEQVHIISPEENEREDKEFYQTRTKIVKYSWTDLTIGK